MGEPFFGAFPPGSPMTAVPAVAVTPAGQAAARVSVFAVPPVAVVVTVVVPVTTTLSFAYPALKPPPAATPAAVAVSVDAEHENACPLPAGGAAELVSCFVLGSVDQIT